MASSLLSTLTLLCFLSSVYSHYISIPLSKQPVTGRFVAKILHGTQPNQLATNLVLDLGGSVTKLDCRKSSTHLPVTCPSLQCSKAGRAQKGLGDYDDGQLVEDDLAVGSVSNVDRFLFYCVKTTPYSGVLGLGRSRMSLPYQISMSHSLSRKFSLCLSSDDGGGGRLLIGDAFVGTEISKRLIYTPLRTQIQSSEHFIQVQSINVGSDADPVKVNGLARLSTTTPYTTMKSSIYQPFKDKFVKAVMNSVKNNNVTVVKSKWQPFDTCFVGDIVNVPKVELVLQSKMVKWGIGKRMMIVVDKEKGVSCFGILEGGDEDIVIGRYQLEENLLEFDMGRSMLGVGAMRCADDELKKLDSNGSWRPRKFYSG